MGKRQVWNESHFTWLDLLTHWHSWQEVGCQWSSIKDNVVVAKHNTLWFSCSTTCVNDDATLSWSLFGSDTMNNGVFYLLADLQELFERIHLWVFCELLWYGFITPMDNSFHFGKLVHQAQVHLQHCNSLDNDYLSSWMFGLILASFRCISGINSTNNVVMENTTIMGNGPLWWIKTHDINGLSFLNT